MEQSFRRCDRQDSNLHAHVGREPLELLRLPFRHDRISCSGRESNSHALRGRQGLSLVRFPVSPPERWCPVRELNPRREIESLASCAPRRTGRESSWSAQESNLASCRATGLRPASHPSAMRSVRLGADRENRTPAPWVAPKCSAFELYPRGAPYGNRTRQHSIDNRAASPAASRGNMRGDVRELNPPYLGHNQIPSPAGSRRHMGGTVGSRTPTRVLARHGSEPLGRSRGRPGRNRTFAMRFWRPLGFPKLRPTVRGARIELALRCL